MERPDFNTLLEKYRRGECTPDELDLLESWYMQYNDNAMSLSEAELQHEVAVMTESLAPHTHVSHSRPPVLRRLRLPLGIAASILIFLSIGYLFLPAGKKQSDIAMLPIRPGRQAASLTLTNGVKIILSDQLDGEVARESGVSITKTADGELIYEMKNSKTKLSGFNTLSTTNGETYRVKLPDGSMVWLNAASSLKYPVSFVKNGARVVHLTGEAYFEIAKDRTRPFLVNSKDQQVEVLGTHFNINAYQDEPIVRTTLLEGSIHLKAKNGSASKILKPGQQAELQAGGISVTQVDTRSAIAWKDGYFRFRNENLQAVMHKIARWYNVEVLFENGLPEDTYSGAVTRHGSLEQVLEIMEGSNNIHFTIKGRRIIISR